MMDALLSSPPAAVTSVIGTSWASKLSMIIRGAERGGFDQRAEDLRRRRP